MEIEKRDLATRATRFWRTTGNNVAFPVSWKGSQDVSSLAGKDVKLHFKLRNCKLYAFQFQE